MLNEAIKQEGNIKITPEEWDRRCQPPWLITISPLWERI